MKKKFYITTAIAYPNSKPHLGHALEIIQADVVARFHKLLGKDVYFQTGTDEHGLKNWETARKEGKEIYEFLDENVQDFIDLYKKLNIKYDNFIRTSNKKMHYPGATKLWKSILISDDIYKKKYKGLYCTGCESFKTSKELEDDKCPNHPTRKIENVEEENYFFKLSKYAGVISNKIQSDLFKVTPETKKKEILSFLQEARDISFSRPKTTLPWGVPVPDDANHVMYVWCDALSNYITGIGYGNDNVKFNQIWPADIQIIGKDILRFHAAFWPAMLLSARLPLPKQLFVHGFILTDGAKMSKSTGNVIEPFSQIKKFGVEQFRFFMMGAIPITGDGEYSEDILMERVNSELVSNVSNFCYRVLSFTNKNFDSNIKGISSPKIANDIEIKIEEVKQFYECLDFKKAIDQILEISSIGNKYFQDNEPWKLIHTYPEKTGQILGFCVNLVKILSILLKPIIPEFSNNIEKQLNLKDLQWKQINFKLKNHQIGNAEISFRRLESANVNIIKKENESKAEFFPLSLIVGKIIDIIDHPHADKLYKIKIDLGKEKKQSVAGLKSHFTPTQLKDKKVVVVTNLEKAKLRGETSEVMILVGIKGEKMKLLNPGNSNVGDAVNAGNLKAQSKEISFKEFQKLKFEIINKKVFFSNNQLASSEEVNVDIPDGGKVE